MGEVVDFPEDKEVDMAFLVCYTSSVMTKAVYFVAEEWVT